MNGSFITRSESEPYRLFFPLGIFYLLYGILLWLPQIWNPGEYPVLVHRYLMLNGFVASFIGGFLMTAVPRFSKTITAQKPEILFYIFITILGLIFSYLVREPLVYAVSALQAATLLSFLLRRIFQRKENPPYTFVFIFVGLFLWLFSALSGVFIESEGLKQLHYEGSIVAIILGVGSRLIPGILGHVEIVKAQKEHYETPAPIFKTVPWYFYLLIFGFIGSYFIDDLKGSLVRSGVVSFIGLFYWKLYRSPIEKTALTWNIWISGLFIVFSFILKSFWQDGMIHASHALFISGIVLLTLLIATRVIQSHGPKDKTLENWKGLYIVGGLIALAAATRVTAYLMPDAYLRHLAYSAIVLTIAVLLWSYKYLRLVKVQ